MLIFLTVVKNGSVVSRSAVTCLPVVSFQPQDGRAYSDVRRLTHGMDFEASQVKDGTAVSISVPRPVFAAWTMACRLCYASFCFFRWFANCAFVRRSLSFSGVGTILLRRSSAPVRQSTPRIFCPGTAECRRKRVYRCNSARLNLRHPVCIQECPRLSKGSQLEAQDVSITKASLLARDVSCLSCLSLLCCSSRWQTRSGRLPTIDCIIAGRGQYHLLRRNEVFFGGGVGGPKSERGSILILSKNSVGGDLMMNLYVCPLVK